MHCIAAIILRNNKENNKRNETIVLDYHGIIEYDNISINRIQNE